MLFGVTELVHARHLMLVVEVADGADGVRTVVEEVSHKISIRRVVDFAVVERGFCPAEQLAEAALVAERELNVSTVALLHHPCFSPRPHYRLLAVDGLDACH